MSAINVLFVDDEIFTLHSIERLLYKEDYGKYFAKSGAEALEIMAGVPIHIIVTDMRMPSMDGLTLLTEVKERYPETVRMALSAYTHTAQLIPCINTGHLFKFIAKPLEPTDLKSSLHEAVAYYQLAQEKKELMRQLVVKNKLLEEALQAKEETERELRRLTISDPLTGLHNRRQLTAVLQKEFQRWKRYRIDCTCMMLDLDHFKRINDTYGHDAGDEVLKGFAKLLDANIRKIDGCFRYGGEEFVVVLPAAPIAEAVQVAERLLELTRDFPYVFAGETVTVTASVGISNFAASNSDNWNNIITLADEKLYDAKQRGRNQVAV
jgi:diguanylate cyclase (GGDEF)-like protein